MNLPFFLRWIARLGSVASIAFIVPFLFSGGNFPSASEWVALFFFPLGVIIGLLVAWRYELLGGLITLASLSFFYLWYFVVAGRLPHGPYFALLASPAFLFLLSWFLNRASKPPHPSRSPNSPATSPETTG